MTFFEVVFQHRPPFPAVRVKYSRGWKGAEKGPFKSHIVTAIVAMVCRTAYDVPRGMSCVYTNNYMNSKSHALNYNKDVYVTWQSGLTFRPGKVMCCCFLSLPSKVKSYFPHKTLVVFLRGSSCCPVIDVWYLNCQTS